MAKKGKKLEKYIPEDLILYTVGEACILLSVNEVALKRYEKEGRIKPVRLGGTSYAPRRYSIKEIRRFLAENEKEFQIHRNREKQQRAAALEKARATRKRNELKRKLDKDLGIEEE